MTFTSYKLEKNDFKYNADILNNFKKTKLSKFAFYKIY